jgi:glycosyltransferase involved in cell wall biosynthesis
VVSRTDPIKRVGLLLAALARYPALARLTIDIFGAGSELDDLRRHASEFPNVALHGYVPNAADRLADYDLLVHTCAEEPFGLALLEAMAAGVPVLVPNAGGAGALVADGVSGFHFPANDAAALGKRLCELASAPADLLNAAVAGADAALAGRFSAARGITRYRNLIAES